MARLLYFAWVREKIGTGSEEIALPGEITKVAELLTFLRGRNADYAAALAGSHLQVAVNQRHAKPDDPVTNGDEIAIFPPVSGGSGGMRL